jgi:hypothetical protein
VNPRSDGTVNWGLLTVFASRSLSRVAVERQIHDGELLISSDEKYCGQSKNGSINSNSYFKNYEIRVLVCHVCLATSLNSRSNGGIECFLPPEGREGAIIIIRRRVSLKE